MKTFSLTCEQTLDAPLDEVFPFFEDPRNLQKLTPPWLNFQIHDEGGLEMRSGLLIDYSLKVRGIPLRWRSEILDYQPPRRFVDTQRRGPYRLWHHTHYFHPEGDATVVVDVIRYATWGDGLVNRLFLKPELRRIFGYRQEQLGEIYGNLTKPKLVFDDSALADASQSHHAASV